MLEIRNINLNTRKKHLFSGEFCAYSGQVTFVSGSVGNGKTTFLNHIFDLNLDIYINKEKIHKNEKWYRQVAYVNQDVQLYDDFTFAELVSCFRYDDQVGFEDVGIDDIPDKKVRTCSEGEKQRVSILVGLWKKPSLILFDEPTSYLDRESQQQVMSLIRNYTIKNQCVTLLSSHHTYDQLYADKIYDIEHQQLLLQKDCLATGSLQFEAKTFDLSNLAQWLKTKIFIPTMILLSVILSGTLLFTMGTERQLQKTRDNWLNSRERYYLSYTNIEGSLPLYYYYELLEMNGEYIPIGMMNYYEDMNMFTKNEQKANDIIVTEALKKKLGETTHTITLDNQTYIISNVMQDDVNKSIRESRYMIYLPDDLYPKKDRQRILYYALIYQNEDELSNIVSIITPETSFINGGHPIQDENSLRDHLRSYHLMLFLIPLTLGGITILVRIMLEKKYHTKIALLKNNGYPSSENVKLQLTIKIIPFFISLIVMMMVLFSPDIPLYSVLTMILYVLFEVRLSLKSSI